jgi:hypothetical protein
MATEGLSRTRETPDWLLRVGKWYSMARREVELMSEPAVGAYHRRLQAKLDSIGWGLLFLLVAVLALPEGPLEYAAAAIVGGLMLALNLLRVGLGAPVRWLSVALGGSMVIAGSAALAGIEMDIFVLFFGLAGAITIAGALRR